MLNLISSYLPKQQEGASAVEYGLILGLIAVTIIAALLAIGGDLGGLFNAASDELGNAQP